MPDHVLIIEDDDDLRESLARLLEGADCTVVTLTDGRDLAETLRAFPAVVIILDINLPGRDGFELAGAVMARPEVGIIMLTGRTGQEDRLRGLRLGADHYLTKPVDPTELRLLVRNLARRVAGAAGPKAATDGPAAAWLFCTNRWSIVAPGGKAVSLSAAEHHLLSRLTETPGQPVRRQHLVAEGRASSEETLGRGLDLIVFRLRRKVQIEAGEPLPVASARGVGYVFTGRVSLEDNG